MNALIEEINANLLRVLRKPKQLEGTEDGRDMETVKGRVDTSKLQIGQVKTTKEDTVDKLIEWVTSCISRIVSLFVDITL